MLKRTLNAAGLSVVRVKNAHFEPQVLLSLVRASGADLILDVGANTGQFGELVFSTGFAGTVVSFEANPAVHRLLTGHAGQRSPRWKVAPCAAVGSARGTIEFNIAANSVSSSVLPMNRNHVDAAPQSRYVGRQTVAVERLDEIAKPYISAAAAIMLKVDTQGYEMEVLKGAGDILRQTVAMQLELSLAPLYDGAPTLTDMVTHAESLGFEMFSIVPSFWDTRNGRLLQADGFFVRANL